MREILDFLNQRSDSIKGSLMQLKQLTSSQFTCSGKTSYFNCSPSFPVIFTESNCGPVTFPVLSRLNSSVTSSFTVDCNHGWDGEEVSMKDVEPHSMEVKQH